MARFNALVSLTESENEKAPLANATVIYGGVVKIDGFNIWRNKDGNGVHVTPPRRDNAKPDDKYQSSVYASDRETRELYEKAILDAYEEALASNVEYDVSVYAYAPEKRFGNNLGTADVTLNGEMVIKGFDIYKNKKGEVSVGFPVRNYKDADGDWQHVNYVTSVKHGFTPEIAALIKDQYEKQTANGEFNQDEIQQRDDDPVSYTPAEGQAPAEAQTEDQSLDTENEAERE